jgi:hypothetical protein
MNVRTAPIIGIHEVNDGECGYSRRKRADSLGSGERSTRLEAVRISVTQTPPVRSIVSKEVGRLGDIATTE